MFRLQTHVSLALGVVHALLFTACSSGREVNASPASNPGRSDAPDAQDASRNEASVLEEVDAAVPATSDASQTVDIASPRFSSVGTYSTKVPASNDPMDVIYPKEASRAGNVDKFPIVVLIQGANVDKSNYTYVAETVAKYGFVVAIPNHTRTVFFLTGLYPEPASILAAFAHLVDEAGRSNSPLFSIVDTSRYGVLGHSLGSVTGLDLISQSCTSPACPAPFVSPPELKGGAFYGASLKPLLGGPIPPTNNRGLGAAILQGTSDGQNDGANARGTYDSLTTSPRAYISVLGANHYGIANSNNPPGAMADLRAPSLSQFESIETIGRWSALFLLATVSENEEAKKRIRTSAATSDPRVTITSEL